jgi:hypothetical protein
MAYNKYRWWTKNKRKELPETAHLYDKILNGDFNYSHYYTEAEEARRQASLRFNSAWDAYRGNNEANRLSAALDAGRMFRVKALKLMEEGHKHEVTMLHKLRTELKENFGFDLWDDIMNQEPMELEDLYDYYCQEYMRKRGMDV